MQFKYQAVNNDQNNISGTIETHDIRSANRELIKKGLIPITIEEQVKQHKKQKFKAVSPQELRLMLQQLVTLISSGITLNDAIKSLAETSQQPTMAHELQNISTSIKQGDAFSSALNKSKLDFPQYLFQLVDAGELTGKLGDALNDALQQMTYDEELKKEFKQALIYPAILVLSGFAAVIIIFVLVVPKFSNLLNKSEQLPWLAWLVLSTGKLFNDNLYIIAISAVIGITLITLFLKHPAVRHGIYDSLSKMPIIGQWLVESDIATWSKLLAILLAHKVSLLKAFELADKSIKINWLNAQLSQSAKVIKEGQSIYAALKEIPVFSAIALDLVKVGEKTGKLPEMLHALSALYIQSSQNRMKQLLIMIEPIAILLIGGIIGTIMTGVILAITSLNDITV